MGDRGSGVDGGGQEARRGGGERWRRAIQVQRRRIGGRARTMIMVSVVVGAILLYLRRNADDRAGWCDCCSVRLQAPAMSSRGGQRALRLPVFPQLLATALSALLLLARLAARRDLVGAPLAWAPPLTAPAIVRRLSRAAGDGDLSAAVRVQYSDCSYAVWAVTPLSRRWEGVERAPPLRTQLRRCEEVRSRAAGPPYISAMPPTPLSVVARRLKPLR
jgi:hypothetical protein